MNSVTLYNYPSFWYAIRVLLLALDYPVEAAFVISSYKFWYNGSRELLDNQVFVPNQLEFKYCCYSGGRSCCNFPLPPQKKNHSGERRSFLRMYSLYEELWGKPWAKAMPSSSKLNKHRVFKSWDCVELADHYSYPLKVVAGLTKIPTKGLLQTEAQLEIQ